jgi:cbb3-type cytochrome oxidase subunit 3
MREIREDGEISSLLNFLLMMFIAVILYLYQLWQDKKQ